MSGVNGSTNVLRRGSFVSYTSIRHHVDQLLVRVSKCLREMLDREVAMLQKGICNAIRGATGDVQNLLVDVHKTTDEISRIKVSA